MQFFLRLKFVPKTKTFATSSAPHQVTPTPGDASDQLTSFLASGRMGRHGWLGIRLSRCFWLSIQHQKLNQPCLPIRPRGFKQVIDAQHQPAPASKVWQLYWVIPLSHLQLNFNKDQVQVGLMASRPQYQLETKVNLCLEVRASTFINLDKIGIKIHHFSR